MDKLEKLLDDIRVLEGDLERVEHEGVKKVILNMIDRKKVAVAKIRALEGVRKKAYNM